MSNNLIDGSYSNILPNQIVTKPDGAQWRQFEIEGGVVLITSSGQEVIKSNNFGSISKLLRQYRQDITQRSQQGIGRQYLANGGNGEVYSLGESTVAVKESRSNHSLYYALERMDHLSHVIETELPHWISVVPHYGLITSRELDREYLFMQKIDNGISLEDLVQYVERGSARTNELTNSVKEFFPNINTEDIEEVRSQVQEMKDKLKAYAQTDEARANGDTYESLMPDPNFANILITPLKTPIGGRRFKFWVIDQ